MREIKFRAWIPTEKRIAAVTDIDFEIGIVAVEEVGLEQYNFLADSNVVLEQYTGLKDVNGVEIYEGDIVKVFHNSIDTVVFRRGCFGLDANYSHPFTPLCNLDGSMEVIGSIHQNPELLEG